MPSDVLDALRPGVLVAWTYEQDGRRVAEATFEIVDVDVAGELVRCVCVCVCELYGGTIPLHLLYITHS